MFFRPSQESQKIFRAAYPMDATQVKTKLIGYGFSLLEGIDPNSENYVCAGIIHTKTVQIGCLLRLEPNTQAQVGGILRSFLTEIPINVSKMVCLCCP